MFAKEHYPLGRGRGVVPSFYRQGGGFLIPDSILNRWIDTDPKKHLQVWSDANNAHDQDLVPLIKMIKAWNRQHSGVLRSFHLETLMLQILAGIRISDFPSGVRYVMDKARGQVEGAVADPAGYDGNVGAYLNTQSKIADVVSRLEADYRRSLEAEALERDGKTSQAYEKWRVMFGEYFPAFG